MNLEFNQNENGWVSSPVDVSSNFNVHLESSTYGKARIYVNSAGGAYTLAAEIVFTLDPISNIYCAEGDCEILGSKRVIIVSGAEPVASNCFVNEI